MLGHDPCLSSMTVDVLCLIIMYAYVCYIIMVYKYANIKHTNEGMLYNSLLMIHDYHHLHMMCHVVIACINKQYALSWCIKNHAICIPMHVWDGDYRCMHSLYP